MIKKNKTRIPQVSGTHCNCKLEFNCFKFICFKIEKENQQIKRKIIIEIVPVVAVNLRVTKVWNKRFLQASYLPFLLQLPGTELVFGVLDDVLEGETEDGGVFDLLEIKQESNLSLQRFTFKTFIFKTVLRIKIGKSRLKWKIHKS